MPKLGEIKKGFELGYKTHTARIWAACEYCGKERWTLFIRGKPENSMCESCSNRIKAQRRIGDKNSNWKGGQCRCDGYVFLTQPTHPRANRYGYVKRSILVLEQKLGRHLLPGTHCHHKNEIKHDDSPENLLELSNSQHSRTTNRRHGGRAKYPMPFF